MANLQPKRERIGEQGPCPKHSVGYGGTYCSQVLRGTTGKGTPFMHNKKYLNTSFISPPHTHTHTQGSGLCSRESKIGLDNFS